MVVVAMPIIAIFLQFMMKLMNFRTQKGTRMFWIKLFVSSEIIEKQIEKEFLNKIGKLGQNDNCYEIRKNSQEM